jgi:hypothetical protein
MSRHLMARFRHLHAAESYDWQRGRPLGWSQWTQPRASDNEPHNPDDHISAVVHHGEKRYGLEVMPDDNRPGQWVWGTHEHRPNADPDNYHEGYGGEWINWTSPGEWDHPPGTPAKYHGHADSPDEAMKAAQDDWEAHKAHVDAQNPLRNGDGEDYDINQIMRDQGF